MKITLKVEKDNTVENIQHEITKIKIYQITKSLIVIKNIFEIVQKDETLKGVFTELLNGDGEDSGNEVIYRLAGAYETLLFNVPDKAIELLSVLSGIDKDVLTAQDAEEAFDIYDAVLEVNDIEKLINRAKKSLAVTKKTIKFKNLVTKAQVSPVAQTTQQ